MTDRKLVGLADVPLSAEAELIGRIEAGKLNPFEIEAQRREAGLPLLAGWADAAEFDPMKLATWPLIMATAWIIWRSPEAVREQWPEYRAQSTFWNTRTDVQGDDLVTRYFIDQKPQRSIGHMIASAHARDALQHVRASDAVEELLGKLQDERSELVGTGLPKPNGRREKISIEEWVDLIPHDGDRHHDGAWGQGDHEPRWYEVRVERDDVLRLWPPLPAVAPVAAKADGEEIAAEAPDQLSDEQLDAITKGLPREVLKWEKTPSKGQSPLPTAERYPFWTALQVEAGTMTRGKALEVWNRLPEEIRKVGRPSKTQPETLPEV